MVKECAVEPESMALSLDRFLNLLDRFGLDKGRVISEFPENWCERVRQASSGLRTLERHRVTERLVEARGTRIFRFRRPYSDRIGDWLRNAVHQHQSNGKFHAIVGLRTDPGIAECVLSENVDETHPLFATGAGGTCQRTGIALAEVLAPFLQHSREVLFVDKFFNPAVERWQTPLRRVLAAAVAGGRQLSRVEFHYLEHRDTMSLRDIERNATNIFKGLLPSGVSIRLSQWRERNSGEEFHARYVLTEKVGIYVDAGLAAGAVSESTDWGILPQDVRTKRWAALQRGSTVFEPVGESLVVDHYGKCTKG